MDYPKKKIKCEIYRDSMQNYKRYATAKLKLPYGKQNAIQMA